MSKKKRRKRCYRDERSPENPRCGKTFAEWIRYQSKTVKKEDKNFTCLCYAPVRSGKSNLSMLAYDLYSDGEIDLSHVGFSPETNIKAFKHASETKGFVLFDEFNLSRRRSMASWNVDVIDMLNAVAGLNLGLWANNPSADTIDKDFIEQGLCQYFVFIYAPRRRFYVFTLQGMQELLRDHGNLNFYTVKKHGKYYAWLDSYWNEYKGDAWKDYLDMKQDRMLSKVDSMYQKYAEKTYTITEASVKMGVSRPTVYKYLEEFEDDERFTDAKNGAGKWQLKEKHLELLSKA